MNYFKTYYGHIIVSCSKGEEVIEQSVGSYLGKMAIKNLFSLKGYFEGVRLMIGIKKEIPIYFNREMLVIPFGGYRNQNSMFLNYYEIKTVVNLGDRTLIIFQDGSSLAMNIEIKNVIKALKKAEVILGYLETIKK